MTVEPNLGLTRTSIDRRPHDEFVPGALRYDRGTRNAGGSQGSNRETGLRVQVDREYEPVAPISEPEHRRFLIGALRDGVELDARVDLILRAAQVRAGP